METTPVETMAYLPVIAEAHTPPYKIHRYFARRPWNVFKQLIEIYSRENEVILDPFCGGGVTIYEGVKTHRRVMGFDLNPLSIFIVKNMVRKDIQLDNLDESFNQVLQYLEYLYGDFNQLNVTKSNKNLFGQKAEIQWNELAFNVYCNFCGAIVSLSNKNRVSNGRYNCPNLKCEASKNSGGYIEPKDCKRDGYNYLFSVASSEDGKKIVNYDSDRLNKIKAHIKFLKSEILKHQILLEKEEIPFNWDRQHEDLLNRKGIKTFQDFFTERNLLLNTLILHFINTIKASRSVYEVLRLVFSSSLRDTNIMAFTNDAWQSGKPTTWAKHAYWVPSQFCEVNVSDSLIKAFNRVRGAITFNQEFDYDVVPVNDVADLLQNKGNFLLKNASIEDVDVPANSVDAIITDPPYGSNVQYLELSHFWYAWNKDLYGYKKPDFTKEAVCNRKKNFQGAKNMSDYEENLYRVFSKSYRALKPNRHMVLTFNNKDMGAWLALLFSIFRSGFSLEEDGLYFQDGVNNYRQTAHTKYEGSPYGDFIYVFKKTVKKHHIKKEVTEEYFIAELDSLFKMFILKFEDSKHDRNEAIRNMFFNVIPIIESFVKSGGLKGDRHNLYSHFGKNYLKDIYA